MVGIHLCPLWHWMWRLLCQRHQIRLQSQNWGYLVCTCCFSSTVTSRASKHQEVQSMLLWTHTDCPSCRLTWLHTLGVEVWAVSRLKAPLKTRSCELRLGLDADCCGKCLKILLGSSDPTSWFCAVLQSPKRYISNSNLAIESRFVDTSAGLIVPKTALTCSIFSTTKFWSQRTQMP